MNRIQILGTFLNLIVYLIMIFPVIIISLKKDFYKSKKHFIFALILSSIIEIILSIILYIFSENIFSLFSNTSGVVNYAIYASKILFVSSSLYGFKILIPSYLFHKKFKKKSATLILLKIAVCIILIFAGYHMFNLKGIFYAFPATDLIFCVIYSIIFIRNNF